MNKEEKLEKLLSKGLESGDANPLTKTDFEATKKRGLEQIKNNPQSLTDLLLNSPLKDSDINLSRSKDSSGRGTLKLNEENK